MSIITFKSNGIKETGQTLSISAVATQMAIEHNYKILVISTSFNDKTLENCFYEINKESVLGSEIQSKTTIGVETGVEGIVRVMSSNRATSEIVKNYAKTILRDRLDILPSPITKDYKDYQNITSNYPEVLKLANGYYDIVFVDISRNIPKQYAEEIIKMSDVVVVNLLQRLQDIDTFVELRKNDEFYRRKNIMLLIGRYDSFSKYNIKNVTRYLREKKDVATIPYNTLFFEACAESKIIDYFLKLKNVDESDRNYLFIQEVNKNVDGIIDKIGELQMNL